MRRDHSGEMGGRGEELDPEMMAKVFTFPISIYLKIYLAKKRGQKDPSWWVELQACVPIHLVSIHASWERSLAPQCFTTMVSWAGQLGV